MVVRLVDHPKKPWLVWRTPEPGRHYVIGADVAQGAGEEGCASTACVLDVLSLEQIAEYETDELDTYQFAYKLYEIGLWCSQENRKRLPFLCVEANSIGQGVLNVLRWECKYWNLYRRRTFDRIENDEVGKLGYYSGGGDQGRDLLIADAQDVFRNHPSTIRSKRLYQQLLSFLWMRRGKGDKLRAEHAEGERDDLVDAWMLALHAQKVAYYAASAQQRRDQDVEQNRVSPVTHRAWRHVERRRKLERLGRVTGAAYSSESEAWTLSSWPR